MAQEGEFTVSVSKHKEELSPGAHYTLFFSITNNSKKTREIWSDLSLPSSFRLLLKPRVLTVKPGQMARQMLTFKVSKQAASGNSKAVFSVLEKGIEKARLSLDFTVIPIHKLNVSLVKSPGYLRTETEFSCIYSISNLGNQTEEVQFESKNALDVFPRSVLIKSDSTVLVTVRQRVPETIGRTTIVLNNLRARVVSKDTVFSDRIAISVYPKGLKKPDLFHRFPVEFSRIYGNLKGLDTITFFKYKISGNGFLDVNEKHHLSFEYSGPNQIEIPRFGEYEYYSVSYKNKWMEASVGDVNFSLSSMTENSRSGRGVVLVFKNKKSEWTSFFVQPRFTNQISDAYGFKSTYFLSQKFNLKAGFMSRSLHESDLTFSSKLFSLESNYGFKGLKMNAELAFESNPFSQGWGGAASVFYQHKKIDIGSSIQYSDKDFKGYLRNSKQLLSYARWRVSPKVQVSGTVFQTAINPVKDTINFTSFPRMNKYQLGVSYRINQNHRLKLSGYFREKEDQQSPKSFEFEERLLSVSYQFRHKNKLDISWRNQFGNSINYLADSVGSRKVLFSTANFRYNFSNRLILGLNGTYQSTNKNAVDNALVQSFYYGGNLQYFMYDDLNISLFYKNDYDFDEFTQEQSFVEASLNYQYKNRHKIALSAAVSSLSAEVDQKELFVSAAYTFVLNVPLSKNKKVGAINGIIKDKKGKGCEGVMVFIDDKIAVSDSKGRFYFYNLLPKEYLISVKQSSLPKGKIILTNLPFTVDVLPNKESDVLFRLGPSAKVFGKVVFKRSKTTESTKFVKTLPKMIVKIMKEDQKFLTQMDKNGYFYFNELEPGTWRVELLVKGLTKDFSFDTIKKTIELRSGERKQLVFYVTNKKRAVRKSKKTFKL
ncbi:MAG: hypothetical protein COB60_10095 [Flavobacteriaceae bacterium]|nr:MAG: hypothetical protein COB60_10095 [Flavobacteriaceae bacterium]